ncbi:hypothetical protein BKA93DRAFT_811148 [Sparassis latifolia]
MLHFALRTVLVSFFHRHDAASTAYNRREETTLCSPINHLPLEILGHIIQFVPEPHCKYPWIGTKDYGSLVWQTCLDFLRDVCVTHVSRHLRDITTDLRLLWAHIRTRSLLWVRKPMFNIPGWSLYTFTSKAADSNSFATSLSRTHDIFERLRGRASANASFGICSHVPVRPNLNLLSFTGELMR